MFREGGDAAKNTIVTTVTIRQLSSTSHPWKIAGAATNVDSPTLTLLVTVCLGFFGLAPRSNLSHLFSFNPTLYFVDPREGYCLLASRHVGGCFLNKLEFPYLLELVKFIEKDLQGCFS
jgi:hypothetical protein